MRLMSAGASHSTVARDSVHTTSKHAGMSAAAVRRGVVCYAGGVLVAWGGCAGCELRLCSSERCMQDTVGCGDCVVGEQWDLACHDGPVRSDLVLAVYFRATMQLKLSIDRICCLTDHLCFTLGVAGSAHTMWQSCGGLQWHQHALPV